MKILIVFAIFALCVPSSYANDDLPSTNTDIRTQVIEQEEVQETIKKEIEFTNTNLKEAEKLAVSAEKQARLAETETEKALAEFLSVLQFYRTDISNIKLKRITSIESKIESMQEKTDLLKTIEKKLNLQSSKINLQDLELVTTIWRDIVDGTLSHLFFEEVLEIKAIPLLPSELDLSGEKFKNIKIKITSTLKEASKEKADIELKLAQIDRAQRDISARLLLNAGRVRARAMNQLIAEDLYSVWYFDSFVIEDYIREVKVVPHRLLAIFVEKYFDFRLISQDGLKGWIQIFKQLSILLFVLFLPLILFGLFKKISSRLEEFRKQIFTSSQLDFKKRTKVALWIGRINPYMPWLFAFIAVSLSDTLLHNTLLDPITTLLPYLKIYILYRTFLILFSTVLAKVLLSRSLEGLRNKQRGARSTAYKLSVLFFTQWAFLHAVEDAVRQALIYNLIFDIILYINFAIVAIEARRWKTELLELSEQWLPEKLQNWFFKNNSLLIEFVICPMLFFGNIFFLVLGWLYQWLSHFEFGKQISSELFKKRLEDATEDIVKEGQELDEDYRKLFSSSKPIDKNVRISLSRSPYKKCVDIIESWQENKSPEDLILLYGNLGIGKTTLLNAIEGHFSENLDVKKVVIEKKYIQESALFRLLSESLGAEIKTSADLQRLDKTLPKTLIILDDIHNLYLNIMGGLGAYRALIELTSLQLQNIFWCLSCNERALAHLKGIFGPNHFTGTKIELLSWTDTEIQQLIVKRHNQSPYKLRFDQVISAVHRGDILETSSAIDVQFFRLLWGQSRGNPSTAEHLWLSAAGKEANNVIRITVPEFTSPRTLAELSDEVLMIYAAIVKHENLSFSEIKEICKTPTNLIRQAVKFGEDGMILEEIEHDRWRIYPKAQYVVHAQLMGRNLIYG